MKHGARERGDHVYGMLIGELAVSSLADGSHDRFKSGHGSIEYCANQRRAHELSCHVSDAYGYRGVVVELGTPSREGGMVLWGERGGLRGRY